MIGCDNVHQSGSSCWILSRFGYVNVSGHMLMSLWCHDQADFFWLSRFCSLVSVNVLGGLAHQTFTSKVILFMIWLCFWIPFSKRVFSLVCFSVCLQTSSGRSSRWRWIHRLNYGNFMHYGMSHIISYNQLLHSRDQHAQKQAHILLAIGMNTHSNF